MSTSLKIRFIAFGSAKERYQHSFAEPKSTVGFAILLIACLSFFSTTAIAQNNTQPEAESQTLEVQVLDEDGQPIEGASLVPRSVGYQRHPRVTSVWQPGINGDATKFTDEQGAATLVFPINSKGPITEVGIQTTHDSFVKKISRETLNKDIAKITLKRGLQVAASAIDPVTKEPIKENLYAMTNRHTPIDWRQKSNGTLVSPVIGEDEKSFRLVQLSGGKAIRFSKLIEILPTESSRLRVNGIEMVDAVTVTGKLGDEVPRPVRFGMVMACVASISELDKARKRRVPDFFRPSWCWRSFSKVNKDGTFTLEGIPADSVLQICCGCQGWANAPLTKDQMRDEFPQEATADSNHPLPQLFQIGEQNQEITVSMQPLGSVSIKLVDQDDQPIKSANVNIWVPRTFFYSKIKGSYNHTESSAQKLTRLRQPKQKARNGQEGWWSNFLLPVFRKFRIVNDRNPKDFYTEFSYYNNRTDATGSVVIDGIPQGSVSISARCPNYQKTVGNPRAQQWVALKSDENVEVKLKLNRIVPKDGGDDD